jgi:hypothetical protein
MIDRPLMFTGRTTSATALMNSTIPMQPLTRRVSDIAA